MHGRIKIRIAEGVTQTIITGSESVHQAALQWLSAVPVEVEEAYYGFREYETLSEIRELVESTLRNYQEEQSRVYWTGLVNVMDDFGNTIHDEFIDGRSGPEYRGAWGIFTPEAWKTFGCGGLGTGLGQRYRKQDDGRWLKVEG